MPSTFARRFKLLREAKGWSVRRCARELGISPSAVQKYEKGETSPTLDTLHKLSHGFGVGEGVLCGVTELNIIPKEQKPLYFKREEDDENIA